MTVDRGYVHQRAAVPRAVVDGGLELVCQELHDPAAGGRGHMTRGQPPLTCCSLAPLPGGWEPCPAGQALRRWLGEEHLDIYYQFHVYLMCTYLVP